MTQAIKTVFILLMILVTLTGCYSYKPVPKPVDGSSYTDFTEQEHKTLPPECKMLTLSTAQEIALKNNPDFISKYHAMKAAWARFYQSLSAYFPTITSNYGISMNRTYPKHYSGPNLDPRKQYLYRNEMGVQGQLLVFDGLIRTMTMLAARQDAKQSESINEDARRILLKSVSDQYNEILLSIEQINIEQANLNFNREQERESEIKFEAGSVALTDVLNFRIQATQAENNLITAQYRLKTARYILAELMGLTEGTIPEHIKFPSIDNVAPQYITDIGVYLDTALSNRPDLQASRRQLQSSRYSYYSIWGSLSPKVYFNMGYSHTWDQNYIRGDEPNEANPKMRSTYKERANTGFFNYGMSINWEMFSGGRRFFRIREFEALVAQNEYLLEEQWLKVISDVRLAYDECRKTTEQLILFSKIQKDALKNRNLVEEDYKAGNTDIIRLNQAQTDLVTAQSDLAKARINVLNARAQLAAAIGVN